ncbi:hypothetical protein NPIL_406761 [Nephila pilipes]|uniref:TIL domain-containing protein n=1 Tax=Nephila pilipes TaxID=299642 RepID=A0A8X6MV47_NEPPI|nr:hypothetical protein NPIL_406761 [Nephila pilipes]
MRDHKLLLLLALVLITALEFSEGQGCDDNEHFVECVNPCNTCRLRAVNCDIICEEGCDCLPGHLRDDEGLCVPSEFCAASPAKYESIEEIVEDKRRRKCRWKYRRECRRCRKKCSKKGMIGVYQHKKCICKN